MKTQQFQEHLAKLPEDERKALLEALKKLTDDFETYIIKPIENLRQK